MVMKCAKWFITLGVLVVALAIPAKAETGDPMQGYIAGGYSEVFGGASDALSGGWNISGGMIFHPNPARPFGLRVDLGFNDWNASQSAINNIPGEGTGTAAIDGGYATMWSLTTDALWQFGKPDHVGGYVGLGIGGYRRYAALTNDVTTLGYICDPYWGYCYYGTYYGSQVVGDDTLTKFGYNASVGLTFPVGNGEMYLEARYHYIVSTQLDEYMPIVLGYRF
jgi:hypothetical protein